MPSISRLRRRLLFGEPIVVVSGLPRSGTSMMMRMLQAGGLPLLIDEVRGADESNPHGYFEFEPVKSLHATADPAWLKGARGKAVKIVSFNLTWLPETYAYDVIFMRRDLGELVASQQKMLAARGERDDGDSAKLAATYREHLAAVARFLGARRCFRIHEVDYAAMLASPRGGAVGVASFLGRPLDVEAMTRAVDPSLYRNRA